jgi:hypothetical protein
VVTVRWDGTNWRELRRSLIRVPSIAEGGTGQTTATAAFNALDPLTTKGDLIGHNGTDSIRVPVGTDGQVLAADSTQASGVKWAAPAAGYTLQAFANSTSPGDGSTQYFGSRPAATLGSQNNQRIYIPKAGTIKAIYLFFANTGTLGSNETSTASLRLNSTTDTTISAAITNDAAQTAFSNNSLSIPVVAGDYFEIKMVWATWATNPTNVVPSAVVYIE